MTHATPLASIMAPEVSRSINPAQIRTFFDRETDPSPLMLLSRSAVRNNYDALRRALPRAEIHYAVKSNNHMAILEEIALAGGNFDVCSSVEIDTVLRTGVDPATLIHSHPIKSASEFDSAISKGVRTFVVDNIDEVEKLYCYRDVSLKILIRYRIKTYDCAVVNLQYKFGCLPEEVRPLAEKIEECGHQYWGLCFHIGSQCVYSDNYVKAIKTGSELIKSLDQIGLQTQMLDIGGGFPVEYVQPIPDITEFCRPIDIAIRKTIRPTVNIVCEPGRYISASPVTLICEVIGKSIRDGKIWYYLNDGLYSTFSGIVFDQCKYPVISHGESEQKLSVLAGPTCDSFDVMYDGLMLAEQKIGDRLIFPLTGAYCAVSGSDFNSLTRPSYKVID